MAGRPKKIVESTGTVNSEVELAKENTNIPKPLQLSEIDNHFTNIDGIGCLVNHFFFFDGNAVNMTTTFLPNIKGKLNQDGIIEFSHINA